MKPRYRDLNTYFEKTGKTQRWLAEQLGVSRGYVSLIASGERQPSLTVSLRIEKLTGVPIQSLVPSHEAEGVA